MIKRKVKIKSKHGLHARNSALISNYANHVEDTSIKILDPNTGQGANGKSILSMMSLIKMRGQYVYVVTDGKHELEALKAIASIIETYDIPKVEHKRSNFKSIKHFTST